MAKVEYKGVITNKSTKADIIQWCKDNDKVDWLKAISREKKEGKVYPRILNTEGKWVSDKSATPTIVQRDMDFLTIKRRLMAEFFNDGSGKPKSKKATFLDEIEAL